MSALDEAFLTDLSRCEDSKTEIRHLERTVKEQADIIDDLKRKLLEAAQLTKSDILATNNKIALQETRLLQYNIKELREEKEKAKEEAGFLRGVIENEKQLCRSQAKELEKKRKQCESLLEDLERTRAELRKSQKADSERGRADQEQELRKQLQRQRDDDQTKIATLEAKMKVMHEREASLRNEISSLQKKLEQSRLGQEEAVECAREQERRMLATRESETNVLRNIEEAIKSERRKGIENRDSGITMRFEELLTEVKRIQENSGSEQLAQLSNEVGSLRATKVFLEKQLAEAQVVLQTLDEQLKEERLQVEDQKGKIEELAKSTEECQRSAELTQRYLLDDISKIKQAKAKLRCELLSLRRDYNRILAAHGEAPLETSLNISASMSDESAVCHECVLLRREINDLKGRLKSARSEDKAINVVLTEENLLARSSGDDEAQKAAVCRLEKELALKDQKIAELVRALRMVDEQCEKFLKLKKGAEAGREKARQQLETMRTELQETRRELERRTQIEIDIELLQQEKDRLAKKVDFLTDELRETHTDYREELAVLAKRMSETKRKDATENEACAAKLEVLLAEKRQMETTLRSLERQCAQLKAESGQQVKQLQVVEAHGNRSFMVDENNKLREGLATAISKAEKYKEDSESMKDVIASLKDELKQARDSKSDCESVIEQLNQTIAERERLAAYLQSQLRMKSSMKLKKSSSHSTLMSTSDVSVTQEVVGSDANISKITGLGGCGDEPVVRPLLRDNYSFANETAASKAVVEQQCYSPTVPSAPIYSGTMKHDIPHRWKTYLVLKQVKCVVCLEGLPRVRHAMKCAECGILVHRGCSQNISNTCGLPSACADFYLDSQPNSVKTMTGWIKLWRSGDRASNKWRSAWGTMDEHRIRFFDNDGLANSNILDAPFLQLDLDQDQWRLHMQSVADVGVKGNLSKESYALLIEIRMADESLFLLAPTAQAKQRWVRALQRATNRKMFVQRQQSSSSDGNSMLLGLDAPLNLSINCAQVLDDWLLIGAQEGLFITQMSSLRVPFVVTGLSAVFHLELLSELQMLVTISGPKRQLFALHLTDLHNGFNCERPAVRPTAIGNFSACHLIAVLKDSSQRIRWLCVADPDEVHILQFNQRLGIFSPFKSIATTEPTMCLLAVPNGFVFGTDQFYFVSIDELIPRPLVVSGCPPDWPLAALLINDNELLLAYHNYGVFSDTRGNRKRAENIDWNRAPLEFVYSAPYLFVVHYETLEVLRIAEYEGPNSRCLLEDREVYRCQSAHYLGRGRAINEILFALSAKDRTEVHSFFRPVEKRTCSQKRKQADGLSASGNSDKRVKKY